MARGIPSRKAEQICDRGEAGKSKARSSMKGKIEKIGEKIKLLCDLRGGRP